MRARGLRARDIIASKRTICVISKTVVVERWNVYVSEFITRAGYAVDRRTRLYATIHVDMMRFDPSAF